MNKHVCFDLEDTLIAPILDGWNNWEPIPENIAVFKQWIKEEKPSTVNIFSFAIHDEFELKLFNGLVLESLEKMLDCKFLFVPTVVGGMGSIRNACAKKLVLDPEKVSFGDVLDFWGKAGAFAIWGQRFGTAEGGINEVHLFDDDVEDTIIQMPQRGLIMHMHRVQ